jgi:hypothetical protein
MRLLMPRTPGRKAQEPRTMEFDLHACLRSAVESLNNSLVQQSIYLRENECRAASARVGRLLRVMLALGLDYQDARKESITGV